MRPHNILVETLSKQFPYGVVSRHPLHDACLKGLRSALTDSPHLQRLAVMLHYPSSTVYGDA